MILARLWAFLAVGLPVLASLIANLSSVDLNYQLRAGHESGITAALRGIAKQGDRLFNPQPWGSWFEYSLPNLRVVFDSRTELFPPEVWERYEEVISGVDGWEAGLDLWGVTIVVVGYDTPTFAKRLTESGWVLRYSDSDGAIYGRRSL